MSARRKFWIEIFLLSFFIASAIFLFSPRVVFAASLRDVVISEIAWMGTTSSANDEWIELYNNTNDSINLENWKLEAEDGTPVITFDSSNIIPAQGYFLLERTDDSSVPGVLADKIYTGALENSGEHLFLYKDSQVIDEIDTWHAGNNETKQTMTRIDFQLPGTQTDNWEDGPVDGTPQNSGYVSPTSTPTPTPTPTPSPATATYKINDVKDEDGNILSSVKVYVDGVYVHHYAPETLTFCNGCKCDTYVDCDFGEHTITLKKTGYQDWSETKTINSGDSYEVDPVMALISLSSPTPLPTPSSTPIPSPSLRGVEITATLGGEVLGEEEESTMGFYPWKATAKEEEIPEATPAKRKILSLIFLGLGLTFLGIAGFWLWYTYLKSSSKKKIEMSEKRKEEI